MITERSGIRVVLSRTVSTAALAVAIGWSASAAAQTTAPATTNASAATDGSASVSEVTVTAASRVSRQGFEAPTPTTVLQVDQLEVGGATNLGTELQNLPGYAPTVSPSNERGSVGTGQNTANLRDLGPQRTLVLIDGARPVTTSPGAIAFGFDLNMIPSFMISRVETVTGGASAQWGSDAVAGVVNVIIDKNINGVKLQVQDGSDTQGLGSNEFRADAAFGGAFGGGRGHFEIGGSYDTVRGVYPDSDNVTGRDGLIPNPAYVAGNGQPQALFVYNLLNSSASTGGLITSGPLKGTQFGPAGATSPFIYGQDAGSSFMIGGDPNARLDVDGLNQALGPAIAPLNRTNVYSRTSFDVDDKTEVALDVLFGRVQSDGAFAPNVNLGNLTVQSTNAFLPSAVKSLMATDGISSFTFGRFNFDFGYANNDIINTTAQAKLSFTRDLGGGWKLDGFYSYGENWRSDSLSNQTVPGNLNNALNSVVSPVTGQPVCASGAAGCVPINLFGPNTASPAALAYILGASTVDTQLWQREAAINLNGEPFSDWAGPVSVAAGLEYRYEGATATPNAQTRAKLLTTNLSFLGPGSYDVTEGYLETVVPLARDLPALKDLDFDGAVRVSDYSTSGVIPSYKLGLVDDVGSGLRLRASYSRDIRAPNLQELYSLQTSSTMNITNLATGQVFTNVPAFGGGNPSLKPELADTYTVGATYQPTWLSGLALSIDYYSIDVKGAITSLTAQNIANQCYVGHVAGACAEIQTGAGGAIVGVTTTFINLADYSTSGLDFEADYSRDLSTWNLPGRVKVQWLTNYVQSLREATGTTVLQLAGDITNGIPHWRSVFNAEYSLDPVTLNARVRYVGGGAFSLQETVNTAVQAQTYLDLGVKLRVPRSGVVVYADVNNVFNDVNAVAAVANNGLFDFIGRTFDVGVKAAF
jgi:outer membrane receptor protein involved in Fe transport